MRMGWIETLVRPAPVASLLLKITALLALGWIIHFSLARRNPRWRVLLWRGLIAGVVALPLLGFVLPELQLRIACPTEAELALAPIERGSVPAAFGVLAGDDDFGLTLLPATQAESPARSEGPWTAPPGVSPMEWVGAHQAELLGSGWAVIAVVLTVSAVKAHSRSRRIVRRSSPAPNWTGVMLQRIAADLKCRRGVSLRCSAEVCSPLLTGIFKPSIILPESMVEEDSAGDLEAVLAHELAHLRSRDLLWSRFIQGISVIVWFHPLVWRIRAAHSTACEQVCDAVAARYVGDSEVYSGTLARVALGVVAQRRALAGIPMARRPQIGRRLAMLKRKIWASQIRRRSAVVLLVGGVVVLAGLAGLRLTPADNGCSYASAQATSSRQLAELRDRGSRMVHFPRDRSLGMLRVRDAETDADIYYLHKERIYPDTEWEYLGEARGDVAVPAGKLVELIIPSSGPKDLSPLSRLGADDLDMLVIHRPFAEEVRAHKTIMPHLAGLTGLKVLVLYNTHVTEKGLRYIKGLKSLEHLKITSGSRTAPTPASKQLGDPGVAQVANLKSLETLWLTGRFTDEGLRHLAKLRSLREVYLHSMNVRGPGLAYLAELPSLTYLDIRGNNCGDVGPEYLKNATSLRKLVVRWSQVTDAGLAHLSGLTQLEELDLARNPITNAGLVHVTSMRSLKRLDLSGTQVTEAGLVHLKEIKSLESLRGVGSTDQGMAQLAELTNLRCLGIGGAITDAGLGHLARLRSLEELEIRGGGITDAGMSHIAKLTNLGQLRLYGCPMTDEGLAKLVTLRGLRKLLLRGTNITISGLNHVSGMRNLTELTVYGLGQGGPPLNIAGLTKLRSLSLVNTSAVRDEDLASIGKITGLKHLQVGGAITDAGMAHLAGLTCLHWLSVSGTNRLTDKALSYVANMSELDDLRINAGNFTAGGLRHLEGLKALRFLYLSSEKDFSSGALERLNKELPNLLTLNVRRRSG